MAFVKVWEIIREKVNFSLLDKENDYNHLNSLTYYISKKLY